MLIEVPGNGVTEVKDLVCGRRYIVPGMKHLELKSVSGP